jgi:FlaA1/EpsC-like NDP-sugar epimerase
VSPAVATPLGFLVRGRHLLVYDVLATLVAILIAFAMRFDANDISATVAPYLPVALLPLLVYPPVFVVFGLYRREWLFASVREMVAIAAAVLVATLFAIVVFLVLGVLRVPGTQGFPRSVFFIQALIELALVGGGRFLLRASVERRRSGSGNGRPTVLTLVYGAGEAGASMVRLVERDPMAGMRIVGFLDDSPHKRGSRLMGVPVFGGLEALDRALDRTGAERLLVAMPSASGGAIRRALDAGLDRGLDVRTIPPLRELVTGHVRLSNIRPVRVDDLLRREPVAIDLGAIAASINGTSVVVTGGGGSIGSELVRQIIALGPRQLTVVDNHEWALWQVEQSTVHEAKLVEGARVDLVLGDVRDRTGIERVIRRARPEIAFHAAALKHVPFVERFPVEGVATNVLGTANVLAACERAGVSRFVFISTDKAVAPVSVMGASKRIGELLTLDAARRTGRPYVAVRFGNVLGSSGSVVPTLQRQLENGDPLTITHPDATRYFMTIAEAVSLILEAGATAVSGEVYVLDMGEPVRIVDLARDLVRLAGGDPDTVPIIYGGLRPGERLHESLFQAEERPVRTRHEGILRAARANPAQEPDLAALLTGFAAGVRDQDEPEVRRLLREAVGSEPVAALA